MKKIMLAAAILFASTHYTFSQKNSDCPEPSMQNFSKVINLSFAEDYEKCPVVIEADFWEAGAWKGAYRWPRKTKDYVMFQCVPCGEQGTKDALSNNINGQIIMIDKANADIIFSLKKGDKIKLTGCTWINSIMWTKSVFFIATSVAKIEEKQ
ncbi:MAG: hypothetical protein ACRCZB_05715 [Bacteroidales bacterium]